jgi:hypothetical protein
VNGIRHRSIRQQVDARVYAGDDPVSGRRVYRRETVPGTDKAAGRCA